MTGSCITPPKLPPPNPAPLPFSNPVPGDTIGDVPIGDVPKGVTPEGEVPSGVVPVGDVPDGEDPRGLTPNALVVAVPLFSPGVCIPKFPRLGVSTRVGPANELEELELGFDGDDAPKFELLVAVVDPLPLKTFSCPRENVLGELETLPGITGVPILWATSCWVPVAILSEGTAISSTPNPLCLVPNDGLVPTAVSTLSTFPVFDNAPCTSSTVLLTTPPGITAFPNTGIPSECEARAELEDCLLAAAAAAEALFLPLPITGTTAGITGLPARLTSLLFPLNRELALPPPVIEFLATSPLVSEFSQSVSPKIS